MDWGRESSCGARLCDGLLGVGIDLFEDTFVLVLENTCKDKIVKIHENTMVVYGNLWSKVGVDLSLYSTPLVLGPQREMVANLTCKIHLIILIEAGMLPPSVF